MKIGIVGGGSIGLLLTSYLAENHQITLYVNRKEQQAKMVSEQLQLFVASEHVISISVAVKLVTEMEQEDCLIICVKQTHLSNLIPFITHKNAQTPLLFLQNGMGHLEWINKIQNPSYVGVVEHGAYRLNDYTVNHLGRGIIKLAAVTGNKAELRRFVNELHQFSFPFEYIDDWGPLLKNKLIINAVINPLTALFDIANGVIATNKHIRFLAKQLCKEAAFVLQLEEEKAWRKVLETAQNTKENVSSMRADLHHNRPTEIEAISGYILKSADEYLPHTTFVYQAILGLTEKKGI